VGLGVAFAATSTDDTQVPLPPDDALHALLRDRALHCVYQPFVDLDTGEPVAHEALLRGPAGTPWASPMALLTGAIATGRLAELEQYSLLTSLGDAARHAGSGAVTLFVNIEPTTLTHHLDMVLEALGTRAPGVQVVVEITERALSVDPAGVLRAADRLREAGCAIALDDVGTEPESLAFIPVLRPEVVKLDLTLLRTIDDPTTILVAGAVRAYAEEWDADVVAEGVETAEDLTRALVLGATLGQGWWWGRPDQTFGTSNRAPRRFAARAVGRAMRTTPFELIGQSRSVRRATKDLLLPVSRTLELTALETQVPPMMLSCFEHARFFSTATAERYARLADRLPFVGAFGEGMSAEPAPGVRGVDVSADDPLASEWTVVVLGAHVAVALIARDLRTREAREQGAPGPDRPGAPEFEFVMTHDRAIVTAAAHTLLSRLTV
jgi:EAL domain-containing protein (putative c-di-GMP-specific phosphodiesterase class I)